MNREIKFRGQNYNGEWIYGFLHKINNDFCIDDNLNDKPFEETLVELNSVGQSADQFDKNGIEIYEGDKVKFSFCSCVGREIPYNFEGVVKFYDGCFWVDNGKKAFLLFMEEVEWEVIEEEQE